MNVGNLIKEARLKKGMTQQELADILGYQSRASVQKIENGSRGVPKDQLAKISKALGIPIVDLLELDETIIKPVAAKIIDKLKELSEEELAKVEEYIDLMLSQRTM